MTQAVSIAQSGSNNTTFRNRIINGGMGIWQRGTSGFSTASGTYTADRWKNDQTITVVQSSDVPSNIAQYSFDVTQTNPSYGTFVQNIESANCYDLVGQSVTVSFWAKNISGSLGLNVLLRYPTAKDNFNSYVNISSVSLSSNLSTSWTYYTATFTNLPSNVSNGLQVAIFRDSGTAQTRYTNIQLEKGTTATPFEQRMYGTELALCQRYYTKTTYCLMGYAVGNAGSYGFNSIAFPTAMRATPTMTIGSQQDGGTYSGLTFDRGDTLGVRLSWALGGGFASFAGYIASAEL